MQMQVKIANCDNGTDQDDADHYHQDVGVTRTGDETWQMMGGEGMKGFAHAALQFEKASDAPSENFGGRPATPDDAIFAQCWNLASGVHQALAEAGLHPDWFSGVSIGAVNAALIAGNPPEQARGKNTRVLGSRQYATVRRLISQVDRN
jgi:hypothetical protein